ncbi:MAG: type II secretion system F family protein [Nocardioidaceae bacterium]
MGLQVLFAGLTFWGVWTLLPGNPMARLSSTEDAAGFSRYTRSGVSLTVIGVGSIGGWWALGGGFGVAGLSLGGLICAALVRRLVAEGRAQRVRRLRQLAVVEMCDGLAAEMQGGLPASDALVRACTSWPEWSPLASASSLGGDVVETLRRLAEQPGAEGLRAVAAAWEVAGTSGAALAEVLDRVADGLRNDEEARSEVIAALGPPRATAKMLAVLPVFGLALGVSMGARPLDFLLRSGVGLLCLAGGVSLALIGVYWVERLAQAAEI